VESHRYATLLTWVHDNLHTTGTFCAVGNSSGGGEIAYSLTTWDRAQLLDAVVLTSGPPHTRLDWVCASRPPSVWSSRCAALVPPGVLTCGTVSCSLTLTNEGAEVCSASGPNELLDQSILHPQATLDFGSTRVHVVIGTEDCGNPTVSGLLFHDAITSDKSLEFALGTPHLATSTAAGRAAITRALLAAPTSVPATLSTTGWPQVGGVLELRVHGLPGEVYEVFLGLEPGLATLEPAGWWFLSAPFVSLGGGRLDASGLATFRWAVPATPALQGVSLYDQATAGGRFTNAVRVIVRP